VTDPILARLEAEMARTIAELGRISDAISEHMRKRPATPAGPTWVRVESEGYAAWGRKWSREHLEAEQVRIAAEMGRLAASQTFNDAAIKEHDRLNPVTRDALVAEQVRLGAEQDRLESECQSRCAPLSFAWHRAAAAIDAYDEAHPKEFPRD